MFWKRFKTDQFTLLHAMRTGVVVAIGFILLLASPVGEELESQYSRTLDFSVRSYFNADPALDSRVKVIAFTDYSVNMINDNDIGMDSWGKLIRRVSAAKPKLIIIDKVFRFTAGDPEKWREQVKDLDVPVVVGMWGTRNQLNGVDEIPISRPEFELKVGAEKRTATHQDLDWLPIEPYYLYGPHAELHDLIDRMGHVHRHDHGFVPHLLRIRSDRIVRHAAFYAADQFILDEDGLSVNGVPVEAEPNGTILVNLTQPEKILNNRTTLDVVKFNRFARDGKAGELINQGDVVIIAPAMYTGNSDFKASPVGKVQGALFVAGLVNSVLTGEWLAPLGQPYLWLLFMCLAAAVLGYSVPAKWAWLVLPGFALQIACAFLVLFCVAGVYSPWIFIAGGALTAGFASSFLKNILLYDRSLRINTALQGLMSQDVIEYIIDNPDSFQLEAAERLVTLMFVDVEGFSVAAERQSARETFRKLQTLLTDIKDSVHRYGGVVDKSLGDGLLCYFGYRLDGTVTADHADQALSCAIEIQRANLERCLSAGGTGEYLRHPLRIGINTAAVYIGNLGSSTRLDFTVVGNGVNYAARLESSCEGHKINFSGTTADLLQRTSIGHEAIRKRHIQIKHHADLYEAYEFNPFYENNDKVLQATNIFRKQLGIERKDSRWPIYKPEMAAFDSDYGPGQVHDFSQSGLRVSLNRYLAKGVQIILRMECPDDQVMEQFTQQGVRDLVGEVRWACPGDEPDVYMHGIQVKNLTHTQRQAVLDGLRSLNRHVRIKEVAVS